MDLSFNVLLFVVSITFCLSATWVNGFSVMNDSFIRPASFNVGLTYNAKSIQVTPPTTTILFGKKSARQQGNSRKSATERPERKPKDDVIEIEAVVLESLPNAMFRCAIDGAPETQEPVLATINGKIRKNFVKILVGDKVTVELSPYDLTRGRITYRYR
mmetsp:Transcript_18648/g.21395  ORF Transcript_18648/g.21395 Transcript_18648/m.21395 type:complete len:159 (-) Transcript_18648:128-604(-)